MTTKLTACDRLKTLPADTIDRSGFDPAGVTRYFISGAAEIRYWETRLGADFMRPRGRRATCVDVLTYSPALPGGCVLGEDVEPAGTYPETIDPLALLRAIGVEC